MDLLSNFGEIIKVFGPLSFLRNIIFNGVSKEDVIVLNWIENQFITKKGNVNFFTVLRGLSIAYILDLLFRNILYIKHNNFPHITQEKDIEKVLKWVSFLEKKFSNGWVHCPSYHSESRPFVPHPLYHSKSLEKESSNREEIERNNFFVFLGELTPSKEIETLVDSFPPHLNLLLIGPCRDQKFKDLLESKSKKNLKIVTRYIPDHELISILKKSKGLISIHNRKSVIVSGSVMYALSFDIDIYCIETSFNNWIYENISKNKIHVSKNISGLVDLILKSNDESLNTDYVNVKYFFNDQIILDKIELVFSKLFVKVCE